MHPLRRAWRYFQPDSSRLTGVFLLMLAGVVVGTLKPWPLAWLVDGVLGNKPLPAAFVPADAPATDKPALILGFSLLILILHLLQGGLSAWQNFLSIRLGLRGLTRVRQEFFDRLLHLSLRFHQKAPAGDLLYRATWDVCSLQTLFQQGLITFATATLSLVVMVAVMAQLNGRLTLAALVLVPLVMLTIRLFSRKMNVRTAAAQKADSALATLVQQTLASLPLIQSHSREATESHRFEEKAHAAETHRTQQHGAELVYWFGVTALFGLGTAGLTWLGAEEVLAGRLSVGQLLVFLAYLTQLYEPLNQLSHVGATVASATASAQRLFEILDSPEEIPEPAHPIALPQPVRGAIALENVSFGYTPDHLVLDGLTLHLAPGESVAIVGASGAGKSTLLHLLPRFFDPTGGQIKLDGLNLRELRLADLREQVTLVLQQPLLLPATVANNIAYGKHDATLAEIQAAAQAAQAHDFIQKLPHGYSTVIGDGAHRLSLGEQQRINLARAFLKDAPVLLLDEPTSALDEANETLILASLQKLMQGRTVLLITHRPALLRCVQRVLVLKNGRLEPAPAS